MNSKLLPEKIIFFIDCSLGKHVIPDALRKIGETVEIHDDHFKSGTQDAVWLKEVGRRNWVVLTKDSRIRYNKLEKLAIQKAKVRAFILTAKDMTGSEMADIFVNALSGMKDFIADHKAPFIVRVRRDSSLIESSFE